MKHRFFFIICLLSLCIALPVPAQPKHEPDADFAFVFAPRAMAADVLVAEDEYTVRMSPFDRMLRLRSTSPVTQEQYLTELADNALDWTDADRARLTPMLQRLGDAIADFHLPLPAAVLLIKTTGQVEIGDAHTRANAIVMPQSSLYLDDEDVYFLLAHELFHVITRHDPRFRELAYALSGFRIGPEVSLPEAIAPLQITNPDAPRHDSYIDVRFNAHTITVMPVLLSRSAVFDPEIGSVLDRYWSLRLMVVVPTSSGQGLAPAMQNGAPVLLRLSQVEGYHEQIGRNTRYIIHGEEVLAENFALMLTGADVVEPERIEVLRQWLWEYGASRMPPP
ncbi:MAG: hypothetical protein PVH05_01460 [Burkholderiales bacterium]|jgi:hypothetical protein